MKYFAAFLLILTAFMTVSCGRSYDSRGLSLEQLEALAAEAFSEGKFYSAEVLYTELMFTYPGASNTDLYLYKLGLSNAGQRKWADAEFNLHRVVNEFPRSILADNSQLALAETLWKQRRDYRRDLTPVLNASDELDVFFTEFPESDLSEDALVLQNSMYEYLADRALFTGRFYSHRKKYDAALLYLREALDNYGWTSCRADVLLALASVYRNMGNIYSARTYYHRVLDECEPSEEQIRIAMEGLEAIQ